MSRLADKKGEVRNRRREKTLRIPEDAPTRVKLVGCLILEEEVTESPRWLDVTLNVAAVLVEHCSSRAAGTVSDPKNWMRNTSTLPSIVAQCCNYPTVTLLRTMQQDPATFSSRLKPSIPLKPGAGTNPRPD